MTTDTEMPEFWLTTQQQADRLRALDHEVFPVNGNKDSAKFKTPKVKSWQDSGTNAAAVFAEGDLIGLRLRGKVVVLDIDNLPLFLKQNLDTPDTLTMPTRREDGRHLYYQTDGRPITQTTDSPKKLTGFDTRSGEKGYVILWHPELLTTSPEAWAMAPEWMYHIKNELPTGVAVGKDESAPEFGTRLELLTYLGTLAADLSVPWSLAAWRMHLMVLREEGRVRAIEADRPWTDADLDKLAREAMKFQDRAFAKRGQPMFSIAKSTGLAGTGEDDSEQPLDREVAQPLIALQPDILSLFARSIRDSGLVGEERLTKLVYLAVTTHHLDRLVSLALKGPSSGGKSFITEESLKYFPEEAYFALTAMSEKALVYSTQNFEHRFIVIYEASGMEGDMQTYLIRSLLSEGQIRYMTTERNPKSGKFEERLIHKPGPTGLIVTTTATSLHPENETRLLSLNVTDTNAQTADILLALASEHEPPNYETWHQLDRWIAQQDNRVDIPYAVCIANAIAPVAVRLRRDFGQVLALIRAHAVLHQATRSRDNDGRITAVQADYEAVRDLIADIVSEAVEKSVPETVRETVVAAKTAIDRTGGLDGFATIRDLITLLNLDRSSVVRRVQRAVQSGFLANTETRNGKAAHYVLAQPLPENIEVIPSWETVIAPGCKGGVHVCNPFGGGIPSP